MKFALARFDVVAVETMSPPMFTLPARAPEVFEVLYGRLSERYPMRAADFQVTGGSDYSDFKLTVKSKDTMQVDIGAVGFHTHVTNLEAEHHFLELVTAIEETLNALYPKVTPVDSLVHLRGWLTVDGGMPAVEAMLRKRGELALKLKSFEDFEKQYTFRAGIARKDNAFSVDFLMQKSQMENSHLYVDAQVAFTSAYPDKVLANQFGTAKELAELMLKDLGLERAPDVG